MQVGLYARVSTHDQQTLALQRQRLLIMRGHSGIESDLHLLVSWPKTLRKSARQRPAFSTPCTRCFRLAENSRILLANPWPLVFNVLCGVFGMETTRFKCS